MARRKPAVKRASKHTKENDVLVALSDRDFADLTRAAAIQSNARGEQVGRATLLRELGMPRVRELLASADQAAA